MKHTQPKISIIIPMYNVEKYLRRCLDSVLNQTFNDWQAICVDDGGPDNSGKIAEEYASRDKRFIVIHKENGGVSSARNVGMKRAVGDYIMFLDADDCLHHQAMEVTQNFINSHDVDIVSFSYNKKIYKAVSAGANADQLINFYNSKKFNVKNTKYKKTNNLIDFATERNHTFGLWKIRHCYPVVHIYKRDLLKGVEFDENIKISEDFPFWTSVLLRNPRAIILKKPLYFYVPNPQSALGAANSKKVFDNITLAVTKAFETVKTARPSQRWLRIWNREFLWPFIIVFMRSFQHNQRGKEILRKMNELGIFDAPETMRAKKYKRRIEKIISPIS